MNIPILNKTYNYFDDGRIKESRRASVVITDILEFDKIESDILELWEEESNSCDWLYAKKTDLFIKANLIKTNGTLEEIVFVRTIDNRWFSLGWWGGILDIDDKLILSLRNNERIIEITRDMQKISNRRKNE